jgi:hypothetical protein
MEGYVVEEAWFTCNGRRTIDPSKRREVNHTKYTTCKYINLLLRMHLFHQLISCLYTINNPPQYLMQSLKAVPSKRESAWLAGHRHDGANSAGSFFLEGAFRI